MLRFRALPFGQAESEQIMKSLGIVCDSISFFISVGVINYKRRSILLPMEFPNMLEMFLMYPFD